MLATRKTQSAFVVIAVMLFTASTSMTIICCSSMSHMDGISMPGNWYASAMWMPMPGQTWLGATASFLGMWVVMMVAMMLPSLLPMLWRYHQAVGRTGITRTGLLTTLVGLGYFFVWTQFGIIAFLLATVLLALAMQSFFLAHVVPLLVGITVLIAGTFQLTARKAHYLACCRETLVPEYKLLAKTGTAWRHGVRLGLYCCYCCAGLMSILLVVGVMDLRVMAVVTIAITIERLLPAGVYIAQATGIAAIGAGLFLIMQAGGLG